jgi:selenocysteine lyase/cysteine desulfurase
MAIDVAMARADTPGAAKVAHLNNAGASLPPSAVLDTVIDHLRLEAAIGGYEAASARAEAISGVRDSIARLIGAESDEIALTESATRAWQLAFYAVDLRPGDRVLTTTSEYPSNAIAFLHRARARGVRIEVVPDDATGTLDVAALADMLDERVKLVAINHVPTHNGLVNPAEQVGELTRRHNILYLLDACQSVGQMPVDVTAIGCDLLSATGRKFLRAPRGTGFLYASARVVERLDPPVLDLDGATWTTPDSYQLAPNARRFESWECAVAARLGLGVAAEYAMGLGLAAIGDRVRSLADRLRAALRRQPEITLVDRGERPSGIVVFTHQRHPAQTVVARLREAGVNTWVTRPSASRFDAASRAVEQAVRASVHYYNTEDEVDTLAALLRTM